MSDIPVSDAERLIAELRELRVEMAEQNRLSREIAELQREALDRLIEKS